MSESTPLNRRARLFRGLWIALLLSSRMVVPLSWAQAVIDDFQDIQTVLSLNSPGTIDSQVTGSMLGGERDLRVALTSGSLLSSGSTLGALRFSQAASTVGTAEYVWDGIDGDSATVNPTGLGGVNLTLSGQDAFLIGIHALDQAVTLELTVFSSIANFSTLSLPLPGGVTSLAVFSVPFSAFSGTANFTSVGAIRLRISAPGAAALVLDFLRTTSTSSAPAIDATLTDVVLIDADGNGKASAGDRLRYVMRLRNSDSADLQDVLVGVAAIPNTSLVSGSLTVTPLARKDEPVATSAPGDPFHGHFNQEYNLDAGQGLLANDLKGAPAAAITHFGAGSLGGSVTDHEAGTKVSVTEGSLMVQANGSLTFTPNSTFTGLFTFQYRLANSQGADDATAVLAIGTRPQAVADIQDVTGNVKIDTALNSFSVLANDLGDHLSLSPFSSTSSSGGAVVLNANGEFTYDPPAGFTGDDTFTYTISNGFDSVQAAVTLKVRGKVWFVDNTAGAGDGRLTSPFNSLQAFVTVNDGVGSHPAAGDYIFFYTGAGSYSGVNTSGLTLLENQKLYGQGADLGNFSEIGIAIAPGSIALPSLNGADPVIVNTGASGNGITLAKGNTLRGLTIGNTPNGFGITGGDAGSLVITNCSKTGTGGGLNLGSGTTVNAAFDTLYSDSAPAQAIQLNGVNGTLAATAGTILNPQGMAISITGGNCEVTYSGSITTISGQSALNVVNPTGGKLIVNQVNVQYTGTITSNDALVIDGDNSHPYSVEITSVTINSSAMRHGLRLQDLPAGSTVTIKGGSITSNGSGRRVMQFVNNVAGTYNFSAVALNGTSSDGIILGSSNSGSYLFGDLLVSTPNGGIGVSISSCPANISFASISQTGGAQAITLNSNSGSISVAGGAINDTTGDAIVVSGGNAAVSLACSVDQSPGGRLVHITSRNGGTVTISGSLNSTGQGISAQNNTGGTVVFSGTSKVLQTTSNPAINLVNNTGATISFSNGGLNITTTSGIGFNATGGGTVVVTDPSNANVISSTTGAALNVANTTIGADGLVWKSISCNGAANGIVLNNTGSQGALIVSGLTSAGSGGTIQNTTSHAILLTTTRGPSFSRMTIQNASGSGVKGTGVVNFTFRNSTVNNTGTGLAVDTASLAFNDASLTTANNLSGTVVITGNTLQDSRYHGIDIYNYNGTLTSLDISGNTVFSSTSPASSFGSGIRLVANGSTTTSAQVLQATVANNTIRNFPSGSGIILQGNSAIGGPATKLGTVGSASEIINVTGNLISGDSGNKMAGQGISAVINRKGQGNFNISNNGTTADQIRNMAGAGIAVSAFGQVTVAATIQDNVVAPANSFASAGIVVGVDQADGLTDNPLLTATISNNTVSSTDGNGILAQARNSNGTLRAKIQNNTVAAPLSGVRPGIRVDSGSASGNTTVCLNISGNTSAGSGGSQGIGLRKQGTVSTINAFGINGMSATSSPDVESYVSGLNPAGGGALLISATSGFSNCSFP